MGHGTWNISQKRIVNRLTAHPVTLSLSILDFSLSPRGVSSSVSFILVLLIHERNLKEGNLQGPSRDE